MTKPMRKVLVELAYRLDLSEPDCITELACTCGGVFDRTGRPLAFSVKIDSPGQVALSATVSKDEAVYTAIRDLDCKVPMELKRRVAQGSPTLITTSDVFGAGLMKRLERATGAPEFAGIFSPNGHGIIAIGAHQRAPRRFSAEQRREWLPVASHISAAWRLRNALSSERLSGFVFSADGVPVDEGSAQDSAAPSLRDALRRAVTQRERMRAGNGDSLWPAVVAGEWVLVDRFEECGRRHVVAYPCDTLARPFQVLSGAEAIALQRALDGTASKVIAAEMKVSNSTVSRLIQRALSALGLRDLADASHVRSMHLSTMRIGSEPSSVHVGILSDPRPEAGPPHHIVGLTQAERDVLAAILRGCSHRQIATARGTAKRTVANQVASIFGKLGVGSRRELVARLIGGTFRRPSTPH